MRKNLLLILFCLFSISAYSQFKLGLKFSPTLSTNRIAAESDSVEFETDGTGLRMAFGPIADIEIRENYYVSTGILLVSKRAGVEARTTPVTREEYKLQYVQVPLSLKLYTNEVSLDKKVYFQVGTTVEFNVKEDPAENDDYLITDFKRFDSSLLIGAGLEYKIGVSTIVFGGLSYTRGLLNTVADHDDLASELTLKNDYIGLDFGIKF